MYNDKNHYIIYHPCEYCGVPFHLYERLIFPRNCSRNPNSHTILNVMTPDHLSGAQAKRDSQELSRSFMALSSSAIHNEKIEQNNNLEHQSTGSMALRQRMRPHYFHVVCFDLINQKHKELKERELTEDEIQTCQSCTND